MSINQDLIEDYARKLPATPPRSNYPKRDDDLERRRLLILAMDSINFGSGWHDVVAKKPDLSGARSMASSLIDFESSRGPLTSKVLSSLNADVCASVFGQDLTNHEAMELMTHFSNAFGELALFLESYGSANQLIRASGRSAVGLAERLTEMTMFDDVGYFKRAQIAAADLAREGLAYFDDLAGLTAFADNLVPHVLAVDGLLTLQPELAAHIGRGELLEPGGQAETELRAAAVHVVELITAVDPALRAMDVDQALWERGGNQHYKQHKRPRCRSVYY